MRFATVAAPLALAGLVAAIPAPAARGLQVRENDGKGKEQYDSKKDDKKDDGKDGMDGMNGSATTSIDDGAILNYALTLEHLERAFYRDSLNTYGAEAFSDAGFPEFVRLRFSQIANHEADHVNVLSSTLQSVGVTPVQECTYAFGIDSPATFLATSQLLEAIGVAAYLGAAPSIQDKFYLSVAGSILAIEARHSTWALSAADTMSGFARPYEAPLDFNQVFSLAAPLITSCPPESPALPFTPFPALTVTSEGPYSVGDTVTFTTEQDVGAKFAAFVSLLGTQYVPISGTSGSIVIPDGIEGQSYLILTNSEGTADENTVAGPAIIQVPQQATLFDF